MINKIRRLVVKAITYLAGAALFCCLCADPEMSDPLAVVMILLVSGGWLLVVAWGNGWLLGTKAWQERESEGRNDLC